MGGSNTLSGSGTSSLAGPYDVIVSPKNYQGNGGSGNGWSNMTVGTLVITSMRHAYDYFSYDLKCTNLIVLCDVVPGYNGDAWQKYQRVVSNFYVPDDMVSAYNGWLKLTNPKPLSQFINGSSPYANMVKVLYEKGILVRDWM